MTLSLDSIAIPDIHPQAPLSGRKARLSDIEAIHELIGYWAARGQMLVRSRALLAEAVGHPHQRLVRSTVTDLAAILQAEGPSKHPALIIYGPLAKGDEQP